MHRPACPGCALREVPYETQLEQKRGRLQAAFDDYPHLKLQAPQVRAAAHTDAYRHRVKLPVHVGDHGVAIGLYDQSHKRVLDTPDCLVITPELRHGIDVLRTWLAGHDEVHSIDLRVSEATGAAQLVLAIHGDGVRGGRKGLQVLQKAWPALESIALSEADPAGKRVMGRKPRNVLGPSFIDEKVGETAYRIHPGAFFQVDPRNAEHLHALVREAVGEARTLLDLYAGVGAYARALASGRDRVVAVEEVRLAALAARHEAPPNLEVQPGRVEDVAWDEPFDAAILNPARRGSDPRTLARVAACARKIVYVSCGPESLARDLDILAAYGWRAANINAIDLFPQTPEVESVVTLLPSEPLTSWPVHKGKAGGPWGDWPSGVFGRPTEVWALVVGQVPEHGRLPGANFERIGVVATHSLIALFPTAPFEVALQALARLGHPVAGADPRTQAFFEAKAGLVRPFVHFKRAGRTHAPLHGDLRYALRVLGAPRTMWDR